MQYLPWPGLLSTSAVLACTSPPPILYYVKFHSTENSSIPKLSKLPGELDFF